MKQLEEEQQESESSAYFMLACSIKSPYTKETYFRRLRRFFDVVSIDGCPFEDRCNLFAEKGKTRSCLGL